MQNQSRDSFPSDTKKNPKDCMAITLKSGRELQKREEDEIKMNESEEQSEIGKENKLNRTKLTEESEKSKVQQEQQTEEGKLARNEEVQAYKPHIPFPQGLHMSKLDDQFSKFLNIFK